MRVDLFFSRWTSYSILTEVCLSLTYLSNTKCAIFLVTIKWISKPLKFSLIFKVIVFMQREICHVYVLYLCQTGGSRFFFCNEKFPMFFMINKFRTRSVKTMLDHCCLKQIFIFVFLHFSCFLNLGLPTILTVLILPPSMNQVVSKKSTFY